MLQRKEGQKTKRSREEVPKSQEAVEVYTSYMCSPIVEDESTRKNYFVGAIGKKGKNKMFVLAVGTKRTSERL